jgi:hypothetical protein
MKAWRKAAKTRNKEAGKKHSGRAFSQMYRNATQQEVLLSCPKLFTALTKVGFHYGNYALSKQ